MLLVWVNKTFEVVFIISRPKHLPLIVWGCHILQPLLINILGKDESVYVGPGNQETYFCLRDLQPYDLQTSEITYHVKISRVSQPDWEPCPWTDLQGNSTLTLVDKKMENSRLVYLGCQKLVKTYKTYFGKQQSFVLCPAS